MLAIIGLVDTALGRGRPREQPAAARPMRLAIAGLVHGHVRGFLASLKGRTDVELVGIAEPEPGLRAAVLQQYGLADAFGFASVDEMLDRTHPDAVATFTSTFDHPAVVEASARRHVAVMMEKPLAVSVSDARADPPRCRERRHSRDRQLRDDVVSEPRRRPGR